jgi:hypothetical protein
MNIHINRLIALLIIPLILQGCVPASLTKFSKTAPVKATVAAPAGTPTITDPTTGITIPFTPPTIFSYNNNLIYAGTVLTSVDLLPTLNGTLSSTTLRGNFFKSCALDLSGNDQIKTLPVGLVLNPAPLCSITGTPTKISSVAVAFCSDSSKSTKATCEAAPLVWNSTTSTCSNPDNQYSTQAACIASKNKWYKIGAPIPFRVIVTYQNEFYVENKISTTINIGAYLAPTTLQYTQSDRILFTATGPSGLNMVPVVTTAPVVTIPANPALPVVITASSTSPYIASNIIAGSPTAFGIAKLVNKTSGEISTNKLIPLYVSDTVINQFFENDIISTGPCSEPTYTTQATCLAAGAFTWNPAVVKLGKIQSIDSIFGILYVENLSANNISFATNDLIKNVTRATTPTAILVTDADDTSIFSGLNFDNDLQFYGGIYSMSKQTSVFQTGAGINYSIRPLRPWGDSTINISNGLSFKISPALPAGLTFNTDTGTISGSFNNDLSPSQFTITATNSLGSSIGKINISSMSTPGNFSLSNKQIITTSGTALFLEGEELYQPLTPPQSEAPHAKILKKFANGYQMAIENYNGEFLAGASLDSGSKWLSQKAFIIPDKSCIDIAFSDKTSCETALSTWSQGPVRYNLALGIPSPALATDFIAGNYIKSTALSALAPLANLGARALITAVNTETIATIATKVLYVQYFTQAAKNSSTIQSFYQGDTIQDEASLTATTAVINLVKDSNMKLSLAAAAAPNFIQGADIVSATPGLQSAYTNKVLGNDIWVSDISGKSTGTLFRVGDTVHNHETVAEGINPTTITAATADNLLIMERNKYAQAQGNMYNGSKVVYSISPTLPDGLKLDPATGNISGTSTVSQPRKDYLITASNIIGFSYFTIAIDVRDYFQIQNKTDLANSFIMHKVGDNQMSRKCRINASDIASATDAKVLDVRCLLDAQEVDLHLNPVKLNALVGPGVCDFITYAPYYFEQYSPKQSALGISTLYPAIVNVDKGTVITNPVIPTTAMCESNYTALNPLAPNCDEGKLTYTETTWVANTPAAIAAGGAANIISGPVVNKDVLCAGKKTNCIAGQLSSAELTLTQIDAGSRSKIYPTAIGFDKTWTLSDISADKTNIRVANGTVNNQCTLGNAAAKSWTDYTKTISGSISPFGDLTSLELTANPFYGFYCYDSSMKVKARIRVVIRDWDQAFTMLTATDNQSFPGPVEMNAFTATDVSGNPLNSYSDWDDLYNGPAASYPSCGGAASAHYQFPMGKL